MITLADFKGRNKREVVEEFFDRPYDYEGRKYKNVELPFNVDDIEVLLAYYSCEGYEGTAFVLYKQDGELFEVNGGHCSCNGLEGQWTPEPTTKQALEHRMVKGNDWTFGGFKNELKTVLENL